MSKRETLDYLKLCSNYYSSWEDGTCMESCEYYNHNECPVVYVNGLIADLEAKLAEKDSAEQSKYQNVLELTKMCTEKHKQVEQLKQQLAEKTLTIEQINKAFIENRSLWKGKYERANQDKISFAVEQLENVKIRIQEDFDYDDLMYWLNKQIKQLKEME